MYDDFSHSCNVSCLVLRALQLSFILKKGLKTCLGKHPPPKTDEFSEKFRIAFHISQEMHVVQQFNIVIGWKAYPEKTIFYGFHAEKALFKGPNFAT